MTEPRIIDSAPFHSLRTSIRQSTTQYRYANDNSESLIQPESGYAYAYNIAEVETALGLYEGICYTKTAVEQTKLSQQEQLIQLGSQLCAHSPDETVRHFAQRVVAHFIGEELERSGELLNMIAGDNLNDEPTH